jgi:uncharacterized protein
MARRIFRIEFGRDEFGVAFADLRVEAALPLTCQRTLERFELPIRVEQRIGLIRSERDEASLPPGYEPVLLPEDARLNPAELIEDELILAVPVVPVKPGTEAIEARWVEVEERIARHRQLSAGATSSPTPSLEKIVETSDEWIRERTGIRQRHIAAAGRPPVTSPSRPRKRAMAAAGVEAPPRST